MTLVSIYRPRSTYRKSCATFRTLFKEMLEKSEAHFTGDTEKTGVDFQYPEEPLAAEAESEIASRAETEAKKIIGEFLARAIDSLLRAKNVRLHLLCLAFVLGFDCRNYNKKIASNNVQGLADALGLHKDTVDECILNIAKKWSLPYNKKSRGVR